MRISGGNLIVLMDSVCNMIQKYKEINYRNEKNNFDMIIEVDFLKGQKITNLH